MLSGDVTQKSPLFGKNWKDIGNFLGKKSTMVPLCFKGQMHLRYSRQ